MKESKIFQVYEQGNKIYTKSIVPGVKVYDEQIVRDGKDEFREWNPKKSKLGAYIKKGAQNIFIRKGDIIMYLGASTGTTVSHVSDIVGEEGFVFALDFAPRVVRELVFMCEKRKNVAPILADAFHPEDYANRVCMADIVYMDIAQKNQPEILLKNCRYFLKDGGYAIIAIKARSIDVAAKPGKIFKDVRAELEKEMTIIDYKNLEPFELDHAMFVCKKR